jgi:hypothetical protein
MTSTGRGGAQTVSFAYAGRNDEIDLGKRNKAKLEKRLEPFIAAATRFASAAALLASLTAWQARTDTPTTRFF